MRIITPTQLSQRIMNVLELVRELAGGYLIRPSKKPFLTTTEESYSLYSPGTKAIKEQINNLFPSIAHPTPQLTIYQMTAAEQVWRGRDEILKSQGVP